MCWLIFRRYWLLVFALLLGIVICCAIWPAEVKETVKMTIVKNQSGISKLTDERHPVSEKSFIIDQIKFLRGNGLIHPTFGSFEAYHNFFLDFQTVMDVTDPGLFVFNVWSDDGFKLFIDDKLVSQYVSNREYKPTQAERFLLQGKHTIRLNYFQGNGPLGLVALYKKKGEGKDISIGLSSKYAQFASE